MDRVGECYWSHLYLEVAKQSMLQYVMLAHIIQRMCAVWGLPYKLYVNKVFMFILHRTKTTLKYLARHTGLN